MNKKIAASYFRDRANITDEKLDVLDMNSQDIKLIYINRYHERRGRRPIPRMADEDTKQTGVLPSLVKRN